jgi:microcystin-dependent protein
VSFLSESTTYESGIYQLELADIVQGGVNGQSNVQAQQLANRTNWLYSQIQAIQSQLASGYAVTNLSGGTINNTPIGNTTPSTGVFSTLIVTGATTLQGASTAPTVTAGDSSQNIATTAFVAGAVSSAAGTAASAVAAETTRAEAAESGLNNAIAAETTRAEAAEALKAPLISPALTGSPTAPTQSAGDNSTKIATTAYTATAVAAEQTRASNAENNLTAAITAETSRAVGAEATLGNEIAAERTRAEAAEALLAPLASPALTGTPTAPTPTSGDNSQNIATTAFVFESGEAAVASAAPAGAVGHFAGTAAPAGWLVRDGSSVSRTTYAALFAAIGTTWGAGDGSTTFNVPDARRTVDVGSGGSGSSVLGSTVGSTGGEETHTLVLAEVPPQDVTLALGLDAYPENTGDTQAYAPDARLGTSNVTATTDGGGGAHNNMQPSAVYLPIIKY